ncbi:hypothetical protein LguiA_029459 [Lonicera macranthoides]
MAAAVTKRVKLGSVGLEVSAQGLGCMSMSHGYGPAKPETDMIELIHHAINSGVTFLDTADFYGPHTNEILIGKALKEGFREKVQLASKFGISWKDGAMTVCGDPAYIRRCCEASLKRLEIDCIDLYYAHRIDTRVPIEVTTEEILILKELGIGIVPYSPLGRGFFSAGAKLIKSLSDNDFRKTIPRFQPENIETNEMIFKQVSEMATRKGCTPSQLALAWVHHKGDDVVPIPGTTKIENFNQNIGALSVKLTPEEMKELESYASIDVIKGERHQDMSSTFVNSETPPLSSWKA